MSTSSKSRLNRSAFIGTINETDLEHLLELLEAEDIHCVIDLHAARHPGGEAIVTALRLGSESREMYYAHLPELTGSREERGQPHRELAWAARTALRHRTCLVTRGTTAELRAAETVAELVGLRLVALEVPGSSPRKD